MRWPENDGELNRAVENAREHEAGCYDYPDASDDWSEDESKYCGCCGTTLNEDGTCPADPKEEPSEEEVSCECGAFNYNRVYPENKMGHAPSCPARERV